MMELFRQWLTGIVASALALAVALAVIPEGKIRRIARLAGGLLLILAALQPLVRGVSGRSVPDPAYAGQVADRIDRLREDYRRELEKSIAERTAAYISAKGSQLGTPCQAEVTVRWEGEVPYPFSAVLDIPRSGELARYMEEELGIPQDRQRWQER